MLKKINLLGIIENLWCLRKASTLRYQFKVQKPIYYPKRDAIEEDELKASLQVNEEAQKALVPSVDYYKILGVEKLASAQQIKTAYYNLAKKYHPDANPTPQETKSFQQISEAYHVLNDENNRMEYDRYGFVKNSQPLLKTIALGDSDSDKPTRKLPKFMRFLKKEPTKVEEPGAMVPLKDVNIQNEVVLNVKFLQAVQGSREYVHLKAMVKCPRCSGITMIANQANIEFCQTCGGTGQCRSDPASELYTPCKVCNGKKHIHKNGCKTCENKGFVVKDRRVEVVVPPGASTGDVLKVVNPVNKQIVKVHLNVDKSSYFKRSGNNINTDKYLTISQAVLGGKFKVRGLYQELEVNLGPGIESHTTHCFEGKGIRPNNGDPGDHTVTFKIRVPKTLTTKQRQLILALSRTEDPAFDGQ